MKIVRFFCASLISSVKFDEESCYDFQDMINKLNTFFSEMGGTSANTDYSNQNFAKLEHFVHSIVPSQIEFKIPMIKIDETKALHAQLDVSKATGLADVGPYFLKLSAE
jgi:hypothetical protein